MHKRRVQPDTYFLLLEELERASRVIVPANAAVPMMAEIVTGAIAILDAEGVKRVEVRSDRIFFRRLRCTMLREGSS